MIYLEPFINALFKSIVPSDIPREMDIILEGGAMNGVYQAGVLTYLKFLENKQITQVKRVSGVSCGALVATLYLTNTLGKLEDFYMRLANCFNETGNFEVLNDCIDEVLSTLDDSSLASLNGRLFITYIDITTHKRIVVSEYKTIDELRSALQSTSHLPYIIDGKTTTKDNGFDGGMPYVFPLTTDNITRCCRKTLYVRLTSIRVLKGALSTMKSIDGASKAVEGIQKLQELLTTGSGNDMVSYVEDWGYIDYVMQWSKHLVWWIIVAVVEFIVYMLDRIPAAKNVTITIRDIWADYGCRIIQKMSN